MFVFKNATVFLLTAFLLILLSLSADTGTVTAIHPKGNSLINSFTKSKKILYSEIYSDEVPKTTFYCGCSYSSGRKVDFRSCGYIPRKNKKRAERVEAEHVVPASLFGRTFSSWTEGNSACVSGKGVKYRGRKCAGKASDEYRYMESDLYNLHPAVGEVNGDRSDNEFGEIPGEDRHYGTCDVEIKDGIIEPRPSIRGDIARTYFYMMTAYPGRITLSEEKMTMFKEWDISDPVSKEECDRAAKIRKIQGNINSILTDRCCSPLCVHPHTN